MNDRDIILTTTRTMVTPITIDDGAFFYNLMKTPGWLEFIGDRSINNTEAAVSHIRTGYLKSYEDNGFGYYVIRNLRTQSAMGISGFLKRPNLTNPDFGFAMLPEFEGQGLATEACRAIFKFGADQFGFETVDAITKPENAKSIRLLETLGFQLSHSNHGEQGESALCLYRWTRV